MNFFKSSSSKTKAPPDLVRSLREAIARLDSQSASVEHKRKVSLRLSRTLVGLLLRWLRWSVRP